MLFPSEEYKPATPQVQVKEAINRKYNDSCFDPGTGQLTRRWNKGMRKKHEHGIY